MSLARRTNLETLDKSQFINFYIFLYLMLMTVFDHECPLFWLLYLLFWTILAVDDTALAITTGSSRISLGEQILSLLYSFVSENRSNLCPISVLAVSVGVYLTSISFN
jgi:hypothetical protein